MVQTVQTQFSQSLSNKQSIKSSGSWESQVTRDCAARRENYQLIKRLRSLLKYSGVRLQEIFSALRLIFAFSQSQDPYTVSNPDIRSANFYGQLQPNKRSPLYIQNSTEPQRLGMNMHLLGALIFTLTLAVVCNTQQLAPRAPAPDCKCPAVYSPVCGADGNTYSNTCRASCERQVRKKHKLYN